MASELVNSDNSSTTSGRPVPPVSQDRHQEPGRHRLHAGDAQPARAAPAHPFADLYRLCGSMQRYPSLFSGGSAGRGHPHPAPEALDHRNPQLLFQRRDLVGNGGLRHVQRSRGLAHRTVFHQRDQAFERPQSCHSSNLCTGTRKCHAGDHECGTHPPEFQGSPRFAVLDWPVTGARAPTSALRSATSFGADGTSNCNDKALAELNSARRKTHTTKPHGPAVRPYRRRGGARLFQKGMHLNIDNAATRDDHDKVFQMIMASLGSQTIRTLALLSVAHTCTVPP